MPADAALTNYIRKALADHPSVEEKRMFGGVCFMVNNKMCICVGRGDYLLCRIGEQQAAAELENGTCRQMINNGRVMKDYVYVDDVSLKPQRELDAWLNLCLVFNAEAKSSKKK